MLRQVADLVENFDFAICEWKGLEILPGVIITVYRIESREKNIVSGVKLGSACFVLRHVKTLSPSKRFYYLTTVRITQGAHLLAYTLTGV